MPQKTLSHTFDATIVCDGPMCVIPIPFDPKARFGKARPPVRVTLNGHTYRSTIFTMGDRIFIPLRASVREAAGVEGGQTVKVRLELDTEKRDIEPPDDFAKALRAAGAWEQWQALSFTHKREHVEAIEGAKKPETRTRRIEKAVQMIAARR